jgi:hypothetical protein
MNGRMQNRVSNRFVWVVSLVPWAPPSWLAGWLVGAVSQLFQISSKRLPPFPGLAVTGPPDPREEKHEVTPWAAHTPHTHTDLPLRRRATAKPRTRVTQRHERENPKNCFKTIFIF